MARLSSVRGRLAVVVAGLACAAGAATPAPAAAAEKAIWGPTVLPGGRSAFPTYADLGVDTFELTLSWRDAAPTRPVAPGDPSDPAYRWPAQIDAAVAPAKRHGIALAILVVEAPAWSNGGQSAIYAPTDPRDFADFLTAAARHYPAVRRWMIWGEPNRVDRFQPNAIDSPVGPRAYAVLLDAAYGALKKVSRSNRVIGGMTWTGGEVKPPDFVRFMRLPNGRPPRLDWFGHNPFPFRFPDLANAPSDGYRDISDVDTLGREVNRAYGRSARRPVPLWLAEYSIQSDRGSRVFATFASQPLQARYLSAAYRIADDRGPAVAGIGWYALLDEPPAPPDSANWGLMTNDLRRKPSYRAMTSAPSMRLRPRVSVAPRIARSALAAPGLAVSLTARRSGTITLELRRGSELVGNLLVRVQKGRRRVVRLRLRGASRAAYTVVVRSARGATVRRGLRVR